MSATHTQQRIAKLLVKGLTCASIAKKIGRPGDLTRVHCIGCNCPTRVPLSKDEDEVWEK